MKILMFSQGYGGNTTTFINNEVQFISQKHELKYLCTEKREGIGEEFNNVEVAPYNYYTFINRIKWKLWQYDLFLTFYDKGFSDKVSSIVEDFNPDVIHCHFAYEALILLDNLREISRYKIVLHFHGYDASSMLRKKSYVNKLKYYLRKDNVKAFVVSERIRSNLRGQGIDVTKTKKLHCGIDLKLFERNRIEKINNKKIFLQVSSLAEKKGHEYTLRAFSSFLKSISNVDCKLVLTGGGERLAKLKQLAVDLGVENNVEFVGFVTPSIAKELMQEADFFVHHSITSKDGDQEGIPTAIMEAMAMELPILSTFHAGIPELVEDEVNGYLVDEKDVKNYAKRMLDILSWNKQPQNRKVIEEKFNYTSHNLMLEEFYENIINS